MTKDFRASILVLALGAVVACAPPAEEGVETTAEPAVSEQRSVVVYSGRNKTLIEPLLKRFEAATGITTEIRYGGTAEMAATLLEEGEATPCDLFIAQDAAALGALSAAGLFQPLPDDVKQRVPGWLVSPRGDWVGLSGRARTVVYNTERITPQELPQSLAEVADPSYRGRFGLAPTNASFQAHMAVFHALEGRAALAELLRSIAANEPKRYPKNSPIVEAVIQGEIDWGLVNHYYLWNALKENPGAPAANYFMPEGSAASFLNLAGVGVLGDSTAALELVRFLLSDEAQRYFAEETYEFPLVAGIEPAVDLPSLDDLVADQIDFAQVSNVLESTLEDIASSGLLQ